jgi:hypothetical protein
MKWLLFLWGILNGFIGVVLFAASGASSSLLTTGLNLIPCAVAFLIATVAIGCAGIIEAVQFNTKALKKEEKEGQAKAI